MGCGRHGAGKARDTWSVHLEDLCSSIYMCMRGVEQHMNAEIASMVAGLQVKALPPHPRPPPLPELHVSRC